MCLGSSAPPTMNAAGQALTPAMREQLYGVKATGGDWGEIGSSPGKPGMANPAAALSAWQTGTPEGLGGPLDPAVAARSAAAMAGVEERAATGEGVGGLFGFGRYAGKVPDFGVPALPPLTTNTPKGPGGK